MEEEAEAQRNQPALLVIPLRAATPDIPVAPTEETSRGQPAKGKETKPTPLARKGQGSRPDASPAQPAGGEPTVGADLVVLWPSRRRTEKATSVPDPQNTAGAGPSAQDLEAASDSSSGWTPGGGTAVLNVAA